MFVQAGSRPIDPSLSQIAHEVVTYFDQAAKHVRSTGPSPAFGTARPYGSQESGDPGLQLRLCLREPPHADVPSALTSEWRAIPPSPSMFQRHSRDPSHQVQLSRPHISERCREFAKGAIGKSVEVPRTGDLLCVRSMKSSMPM